MPKVTVIVPIYKTEAFLTECIDSILNQSLTDWELILVNDGSPDNSDEICKIYSDKDSRIHYYYQDNTGVSVARNLGLSKASGEYLYCMDSDDTLDADFLKTSYQTALGSDADITVIGEWFRQRLPRPAALPTCAMMIKKAFLDKYPDIRFPKGIQPCEDGLFSHQLLALTDRIGFNPDGIYHYRHHKGGNHIIINKSCEKVLFQIPVWFDILNNFYDRYNLWDKRALHLVKFLECEPYKLRLCAMPFDKQQKQKLFNMIRTFYQKKLKLRLNKEDIRYLSPSFKILLTAKNFKQFQLKYQLIFIKVRIKLCLVNLIPMAKLRRQLRKEIKQGIQLREKI